MKTDLTHLNHSTMTEAQRNELARAYQEDGAAEQEGGLSLLKLRKTDGLWTSNDEPIPGDRVALLNMSTYARGWLHFEGGEVTDEVWIKAGEPRPDESALPQHGPYRDDADGWQQASRVNVRMIDTGQEYLYSPTSLGGRQALGGVAAQFGYRLTQDNVNCVPKIAFMATSYQHKRYGTVFKPVLKNMGWASNGGGEEPGTTTVAATPVANERNDGGSASKNLEAELNDDVPF